jgi:hypothetical protein
MFNLLNTSGEMYNTLRPGEPAAMITCPIDGCQAIIRSVRGIAEMGENYTENIVISKETVKEGKGISGGSGRC